MQAWSLALKVFAALHSIGSELQIVARLPLPLHPLYASCLPDYFL